MGGKPALFFQHKQLQLWITLYDLQGSRQPNDNAANDSEVKLFAHAPSNLTQRMFFVNLVIGLGPTLLKDLTKDIPNDFQPFETIKSVDGSDREAKGTQEELLFWMNGSRKDQIWKAQFDARQALKGHMKVARETMTFIY